MRDPGGWSPYRRREEVTEEEERDPLEVLSRDLKGETSSWESDRE